MTVGKALQTLTKRINRDLIELVPKCLEHERMNSSLTIWKSVTKPFYGIKPQNDLKRVQVNGGCADIIESKLN